MEIEVVGKRSTIIEVEAISLKIDTNGALDCAAFTLTGLRDEVDHTAGGVGCEGRCRTTTNRFDAGDVAVCAQEVVGVTEDDVAELENWQAIFLKLDVPGTAG